MSGMWEICFLLNGFLLGSLAPLYGKTFNYYLLFMVLFHAVTRKDSFVKDLQTGGKYVLVFGTYFIYILLQTLFTTRSCTWADKPYYGIFEDLLLDFILIPIYVVSLKEWLKPFRTVPSHIPHNLPLPPVTAHMQHISGSTPSG